MRHFFLFRRRTERRATTLIADVNFGVSRKEKTSQYIALSPGISGLGHADSYFAVVAYVPLFCTAVLDASLSAGGMIVPSCGRPSGTLFNAFTHPDAQREREGEREVFTEVIPLDHVRISAGYKARIGK